MANPSTKRHDHTTRSNTPINSLSTWTMKLVRQTIRKHNQHHQSCHLYPGGNISSSTRRKIHEPTDTPYDTPIPHTGRQCINEPHQRVTVRTSVDRAFVTSLVAWI